MDYKSVIAYSNTCVLFQLTNGFYALVAVDDEEASRQMTVSKYAEDHMKLGIFTSGDNIPQKILNEAVKTLNKGENVYVCSKLPEEMERFKNEK